MGEDMINISMYKFQHKWQAKFPRKNWEDSENTSPCSKRFVIPILLQKEEIQIKEESGKRETRYQVTGYQGPTLMKRYLKIDEVLTDGRRSIWRHHQKE